MQSLKVSGIALGCEGFIGKTKEEFKQMLDRAMELGINFIDMYTLNLEFRENMGAVIVGRRDKIVLQGHICSVWENGQYLRTRDIVKSRSALHAEAVCATVRLVSRLSRGWRKPWRCLGTKYCRNIDGRIFYQACAQEHLPGLLSVDMEIKE